MDAGSPEASILPDIDTSAMTEDYSAVLTSEQMDYLRMEASTLSPQEADRLEGQAWRTYMYFIGQYHDFMPVTASHALQYKYNITSRILAVDAETMNELREGWHHLSDGVAAHAPVSGAYTATGDFILMNTRTPNYFSQLSKESQQEVLDSGLSEDSFNQEQKDREFAETLAHEIAHHLQGEGLSRDFTEAGALYYGQTIGELLAGRPRFRDTLELMPTTRYMLLLLRFGVDVHTLFFGGDLSKERGQEIQDAFAKLLPDPPQVQTFSDQSEKPRISRSVQKLFKGVTKLRHAK